MKRILVLLPLVAFGLTASSSPAVSQIAQPPLARTSGIVIGFDNSQSLLSVNTRLGRKLFLTTPTTLFLLNNHEATASSAQPGDEVTVEYRYDNSRAFVVHLFRETRQNGTVANATANSVEFRIRRKTTISLRVNAASHLEVGDVVTNDPRVLVGRNGTAIFEPGTLLLLSLSAQSKTATGPLTDINIAARTLTIGGKQARTFTLDPNVTFRRNGQFVPITSLEIGDRLRVAFVRDGDSSRALAVQAKPEATSSAR